MTATGTRTPRIQANVDLILEAFEALARQDMDACLAVMAEDFRINIAGMPYQKRGKSAWKKNFATIFTGFPDFTPHIEDVVAEGSKVVVRVRFTGTHLGEFLGIQPTGKKLNYLSTEIYEIRDGVVTEEWICSDSMTMMTQIGAVSSARLASMWLAGYRMWFALAAGAIGGVAAGFGAARLLDSP
ncbi:ester cyclase [Nesterenkonia sp. MY13]|uniref:Ester cyclase n=1 Tax=Nesterenkonia sedimenti TaxID=1463632 RepID=A0A7X8YDC9_9MICC|nr:ester cyclase [Nesterenkonia sedimenti]NLS09474.1 ester cyclase [Nesterenkonia sedimenti]